ncbi:MAG: CocE/NonD family hydrolase [Bacteroidota bacterium]|nr:CocE/NonD family hydrolase [Bacteroidota bacterium]
MKKILYSIFALIVLIIIVVVAVWLRKPPVPELNNLGDFSSEHISEPSYSDYTKESIYIILSDSTRIAADIFVPRGGEDREFPVIFEYTPYNRSVFVPDFAWYKRLVAQWKTGQWGPIFDYSAYFVQRNLIARGYAYVIADIRGTGASSGVHIPLDPQIGRDGKEIIDWINTQSWSNGKLGMIGQSYHGWSQWVTASNNPKGLKCIAPALIMFETYSEANRPGGILAESWVSQYSDFLQYRTLNYYDTVNFKAPVFPTGPVVDEDGDGKLYDEIPEMQGDKIKQFVNMEHPIYADGEKRTKNLYFKYTKEHLKSRRPDDFTVAPYLYFDNMLPAYSDSASWFQTSPGYMIPEVVKADIAVLNIGGWFDGFAKGTVQLHASLEAQGGISNLFIMPRFHQPTKEIPEPYIDYLNYKGDINQQQFVYTLRFFDYYLKEKDNGRDKQKPVYVYTIHDGWEYFEQWPPKSVKHTDFFLADNRQLSQKTVKSGVVNYPVNFSHASDYGEETLNRWVMVKPSRELMERTFLDSMAVIFETEILKNDTQITGHPLAEIFLACNKADADIFIYLSDVDKDGKAIYVSEGQLRASWKGLHNPNRQVGNRYEVKPQLPWHGFEEGMLAKNPTKDSAVVKLVFDLFPVSWVFKKGHKIRLSAAGVDRGNFEVNPAWLDSAGNPLKDTELKIHTGGEKSSRIILPVMQN